MYIYLMEQIGIECIIVSGTGLRYGLFWQRIQNLNNDGSHHRDEQDKYISNEKGTNRSTADICIRAFENDGSIEIVYLKQKNEIINLWINATPRSSGEESDFISNDDIVLDKNTELIWQKGFSSDKIDWFEAHDYIKKLNYENYAGYSDWRLPKIDELMSLYGWFNWSLEEPGQERQSSPRGPYISDNFDNSVTTFWSADSVLSGEKICSAEELSGNQNRTTIKVTIPPNSSWICAFDGYSIKTKHHNFGGNIIPCDKQDRVSVRAVRSDV